MEEILMPGPAQWPVPTTHSIVVAGLPLYMEFEHAAEVTTAAILPGDLVEFAGTTNCDVKAAQDDSTIVIGVADISPQSASTPPRGGDRTTAYQEGDQVKIVRGPLLVMLRIKTSEDISCGEMVQPAASGEVKAYICVTDNDCQRIAQAMETSSVVTTAFQWGLFALERFG